MLLKDLSTVYYSFLMLIKERIVMSISTFLQVVKSVLAAFMGVQSKANRKNDFTSGNASSYILVGIGVTVIFVLSLIFIVNLVIRS